MEIRPFRGWRFRGRSGDVSEHIAPPYDVLTAADKGRLLARSEENVVAADMPHVPPNTLGPDAVYLAAAETLAKWKSSGVLVQDQSPAVYAYEQTFSWAGKRHTRRAIVCGVRATELGKDVIPHEHTFPGPKADRLRLTEFTRMQLSAIFGFYDDPRGRVVGAAFAGLCCPETFGELDGVGERMWAVKDEGVIAAVAEALRDVPVFIADGHHRYTTALAYRDQLRSAGQIGDDHEANFVMFALVSRDDEGLMILPTHRIIRGLKAGFSLAGLRAACPGFEWRQFPISKADLSDADGFLRPLGENAMAFIAQGGSEMWIARPADSMVAPQVKANGKDASVDLDVAILHDLVIGKAMAPWRTDGFTIDYTPRGEDVLHACRAARAQLGVCLQSTPLATVQAVALAGRFMPHKSTYFHPKLATGMVLKPLE
ncbi:MAG: DUF1015 family protein [Phycisphaerae bacterium]